MWEAFELTWMEGTLTVLWSRKTVSASLWVQLKGTLNVASNHFFSPARNRHLRDTFLKRPYNVLILDLPARLTSRSCPRLSVR